MGILKLKNTNKSNQICKYLSKLSPVKQSHSKLNLLIQSKTSNKRFKTKKVFLQISKDLFSPENNSMMEELSLTTISKKNPLYT